MLRSLHVLVFLTVSTAAIARAQSAATTERTLSGKWEVSTTMGSIAPIELIQEGDRVQGIIRRHVRCNGSDVLMTLDLHGTMVGQQLNLQGTNGELAGAFNNRGCNNAVYMGNIDFRGTISPDGNEIKGPYDQTGDQLHVWTFRRPQPKQKK
jgi:hypothetical protein